MRILLVSEDKHREPLRILAQKILANKSRNTGVDARFVEQGQIFNVAKVEAVIKSYIFQQGRPSKVLVCPDSECTPIAARKKACSEPEQALRQRLPNVKVFYVIVDHSIEGWLMVDAAAIKEVLGVEVNSSKLSKGCRPAIILRRLFYKKNKKNPFSKSRDNPKLAIAADPETINRHDPTFREFYQAIVDP